MIPLAAWAITLAVPLADPAGQLRLSATAAPDSITVAETVELTITALTPTGWILGDPVPPLTPGDLLGGLTILSTDRSAPALSADGAITTTFITTLAPGLPGEVTIPAISLTARGPGGIEETSATTAPIKVIVRSVLDEATATTFTPGAIRPPLVPSSTSAPNPFVLISIGVAIGITMIGTALLVSRLGRRVHKNTLDTLERDLGAIVQDRPDPARLASRASTIVRGALAHSVDFRFLTAAAGREVDSVLATAPSLTPDERLAIATLLTDAERIACAPGPSADSAARLVDGARTALNIARDAARRGHRAGGEAMR